MGLLPLLGIVGAALALAFGIWAGLGYPGLMDRYGPGPSRRERMGTWLNRWIFGGPRPRRFSTAHLLPPPSRRAGGAGGEGGEGPEPGDPEPEDGPAPPDGA